MATSGLEVCIAWPCLLNAHTRAQCPRKLWRAASRKICRQRASCASSRLWRASLDLWDFPKAHRWSTQFQNGSKKRRWAAGKGFGSLPEIVTTVEDKRYMWVSDIQLWETINRLLTTKASNNPNSLLALPPRQPFTSKFGDPTNSTNWSFISLITGGRREYDSSQRPGAPRPQDVERGTPRNRQEYVRILQSNRKEDDWG